MTDTFKIVSQQDADTVRLLLQSYFFGCELVLHSVLKKWNKNIDLNWKEIKLRAKAPITNGSQYSQLVKGVITPT